MENRKIKPMTEGGILSAISVAMAMIGLYVPILGAVVTFIWPLPIIILVVRHGIRWGVMASVVSGILIAILTHPLQALSMVIAFGMVGLVLGFSYRKGYSALKSLALGMTASVVSKIAVLALAMAVLNINPITMQFDMMREALAGSLEFYRSAGIDEQRVAAIGQDFERGMETVKLVIPILIAFAGMLDAYINFVVAGKVLRRLGSTSVPVLLPFSQWRLPWGIVYLYAFSWIGIYWGSSREIPLLLQVSLNANMFSSVLGFVQGLSVLSAMAGRYNLSKWIRGIILFFILTNGFFLQTIGLVGLFDIVVDYRRRLARRK